MLEYSDIKTAWEETDRQRDDNIWAAKEREKRREAVKMHQQREEWLAKQKNDYWEYYGIRIPWEIKSIFHLNGEFSISYTENYEKGTYEIHAPNSRWFRDKWSIDEYRRLFARKKDGIWWYDESKVDMYYKNTETGPYRRETSL